MHSTLFFAEIPNPGPDRPKSIDFPAFLTVSIIEGIRKESERQRFGINMATENKDAFGTSTPTEGQTDNTECTRHNYRFY